jgi:hypothetical protein
MECVCSNGFQGLETFPSCVTCSLLHRSSHQYCTCTCIQVVGVTRTHALCRAALRCCLQRRSGGSTTIATLELGSCCTHSACIDNVREDACRGSWSSDPNMKCGNGFCTGACCSFKGNANALCRRTFKWDCLPAGSTWSDTASCFDDSTCPGVRSIRERIRAVMQRHTITRSCLISRVHVALMFHVAMLLCYISNVKCLVDHAPSQQPRSVLSNEDHHSAGCQCSVPAACHMLA